MSALRIAAARRTAIRLGVLVVLLAAALQPSDAARHGGIGGTMPDLSDAWLQPAGWRPTALKICAVGLGMMVGGAFGMPLNPLGGATAVAVGLHLALYGCT